MVSIQNNATSINYSSRAKKIKEPDNKQYNQLYNNLTFLRMGQPLNHTTGFQYRDNWQLW